MTKDDQHVKRTQSVHKIKKQGDQDSEQSLDDGAYDNLRTKDANSPNANKRMNVFSHRLPVANERLTERESKRERKSEKERCLKRESA